MGWEKHLGRVHRGKAAVQRRINSYRRSIPVPAQNVDGFRAESLAGILGLGGRLAPLWVVPTWIKFARIALSRWLSWPGSLLSSHGDPHTI